MYASVIGLSGCGKSIFMDAMSSLSSHPGSGKTGLVTVRVPDSRVDKLSAMFKPKKTTYAEIRLKEIPWPEKEDENKSAAAEKYVKVLAGAELLIHVVRAFPNPFLSAPPNPKRDLAAMDEEMILADLGACENFFERLKKKPADPQQVSAMEKAKNALERMKFLYAADLTPDDKKLLGNFGFATLMQQLIVLNTSEDSAKLDFTDSFRRIMAFPLRLADEISQLPPEEQVQFVAELGMSEPLVNGISKEIYSTMNMISFFTVGEDEVRAWTVQAGTPAQKAAGKIHTDLERGFIRAEIVDYEVLLKKGSLKACRDSGDLRIEGKNYIVQDGEIMHVRFNV